jgi:hypothetical protein
MKTSIVTFAAALLLALIQSSRAGIIAGPITNPANGHDYYLLTPDSWSASEAEAESLGGTLAIIRNSAEQEWVYSTFGAYGETNHNLWIGLRRTSPTTLAWIDGSKFEYSNWATGQPDNANGRENCVHITSPDHSFGLAPGKWNDYPDFDFLGPVFPNGVVEVPGKSREKALSSREKDLVGTWYESGRSERPAWIAGTENQLFLITHDRHAARLVFTPEGVLFNTDRLRGEIVKDRILWSNGTWWSRKPAEYDSATTPRDKKPALTDQ